MNALLPILASASVLLLAVALFQALRTRSHSGAELQRRLQALSRETPEEVQSVLQDKTYSEIPRLNRLLTRFRLTENLERLVVQAGFRVRPGEAVLWMGLLGMVAALSAFLWSERSLVALLAFLLFGPAIGLWWLRRCRTNRRNTLMTQLPDALEMVRSSLQAGHSLNQALEIVAEEASDPISGEVRQVLEELRLGHPLRDAFQRLYERTGIEDLRFFIVAVLLNREVGGNLSEVIEVVASTIRERFKLKAQVRALTSQGRFSALILTLLTPGLLLALTALNPEYPAPLYHTTLGRLGLGYAAGSVAFGYYLMRRIVDIKVVRIE